jgi:hypothetical protein
MKLKKPLKVEFIATNQIDLVRMNPPVPASKSMPEWYAKQNSYVEGVKRIQNSGIYNHTIKKCMPVFDVMSAGYIFQTICDFDVENDGENVSWKWSMDDFTAIESHTKPQFDSIPINKDDWHSDVAFKFINPWIMRTPKGYSTLFTMPFHQYDLPFFTLPAIVDTDKHPIAVNFPFLTKRGFKGLISAGTPIIQAIPFKRDDWYSDYIYEPIEKSAGEFGKGSQKFGNRYKTFWREIKTYT